jgi:hypothetical protein
VQYTLIWSTQARSTNQSSVQDNNVRYGSWQVCDWSWCDFSCEMVLALINAFYLIVVSIKGGLLKHYHVQL